MEVVEFLRDWRITQHGVPRVILPDNERQLIAEVLTNICESIGASKIHIFPHYSQVNSICEFCMRVLEKALASLVSEDVAN